MARSNKSSEPRPRRRSARQAIAHLWTEWRAEIFVGILVALAIFLLVEQMQIRQTFWGWLRRGIQALESLGGSIVQSLVAFVRRTTLSDLTGYVLLITAFAFVIWRTRWRLMTTPRFRAIKCPRCGSDLQRIHRRGRDRALNLFVPVRRYRCSNHNCGWRGLRVRKGEPE